MPAEWFALAVRIVGLVVSLYGVGICLTPFCFGSAISITRIVVLAGTLSPETSQFIMGLYLLRGAPPIVNFAYPEELEDDYDEEQPDEQPTDAEL